jgi:hypothetical protein
MGFSIVRMKFCVKRKKPMIEPFFLNSEASKHLRLLRGKRANDELLFLKKKILRSLLLRASIASSYISCKKAKEQ